MKNQNITDYKNHIRKRINTNRKFIGIEMNDKYFEIANKRLSKVQLSLF